LTKLNIVVTLVYIRKKYLGDIDMTMIMLAAVLVIGWVAASIIGTQAYFRGEQTKPIHNRNLNSDSFEEIAKSVTGSETDYANRVPAYSMDAYVSNNLAS
jgi:hypothetical protein